jgi:hypothetical protein
LMPPIISTTTEMLIDCPHACVEKIGIAVTIDTNGEIVGVKFGGHVPLTLEQANAVRRAAGLPER